MGNSRWRLETSINLALLNAQKADFLNKLEIVVSDCSEIPLRDVLQLVPEAEKRVKFVHTPQQIAAVEQKKDSKFAEVIALNAAARRANGEYIGRIDNDTVVGEEFFRKFVQLHKNNPTEELDLTDSFLFVERKSVPFRISRLSPNLNQIESFIGFLKIIFALNLPLIGAKNFGGALLA